VALPVVEVSVPLLVTVLLLVVLVVAELLPPSFAAPVVTLPLPPLTMVVLALVPVADALPLLAVALLLTELLTTWVLLEVVAPDEPEPLFAPPAEFTVPVEAVVLLLPFWPVAEELPLLADAVPVLLTEVVLLLV